MRLIFIFLSLFLLLQPATSLRGQGKAKTISFKSGQVLDVIFLNNQAGGEEARKAYFKEVVPTALAAGHKQMAVFGVSETPTAGNYHPEVAVLGTWPSLSDRKHGMEALVEQFPDFHERRRKSWSSFNMTYYQIKADFAYTTDPEKYYVVSLYWRDDVKSSGKYLRELNKAAKKAGGTSVLELINGESPFGYHFDPDYFHLTEWPSKEAFEAFRSTYEVIEPAGIRHVNQFAVK